jgi:hypothetical protein
VGDNSEYLGTTGTTTTTKEIKGEGIEVRTGTQKNLMGTKRLRDQWRGRVLCWHGGFKPTEQRS